MELDLSCELLSCNRIRHQRGRLCGSHQRLFDRYGTTTPEFECQGCHLKYVFNGMDSGSKWYCQNCYPLYKSIGRGNFVATYNMSFENFLELHRFQEGKCKLCNYQPSAKDTLQIDHSHLCCPGKQACGKCVRGLLCRECNMMIGWYEKCKGSLSIDVLDKYIAAEPFIFSTPNHGYAIRQSVKLGSNERKQ